MVNSENAHIIAEQHSPARKILARIEQAEAALERALLAVLAVRSSSIKAPSDNVSDDALVNMARTLVRERRNRHRFFPDFAFGEPVWDILLDLYIARCTGKNISITSTCIAAGVPPTTALRYVAMMTREGLIERLAHPSDCRVVYLSISDQMHQAMRNYLIHISQDF